MKNSHSLLKGTIYLTIAGFISRILGFFYRIFLSRIIGAYGIGLYQLAYPVCGICYAMTVLGIHTAISRFASASVVSEDKNASIKIMYAGLLISVIPTTAFAIFIYRYADFISACFLNEPKCAALLRICSFSLPFGAIHSCINAYYYAIKKALVPAFSQLFEQCIRIGGIYFIYNLCISKNIPVTPSIAGYGVILDEMASMLFTLTAFVLHSTYSFSVKNIINIHFDTYKKIFKMSAPLTANRLSVMIMQSVETIMIPSRLKLYGISNNNALEIYGVLSGMSLPLVLFPSAITNSLCVMLLPTVSQAQAVNDENEISSTVSYTLKYCSILGILCTGLFVKFGFQIGRCLFNSTSCGEYITTLAWICPFLYISTTLISILNGLGKTNISFFINCTALFIRILFSFFLIPLYGIKAYLWGILFSFLIETLLTLIILGRYISISFSISDALIKPLIFLCMGILANDALTFYFFNIFDIPKLLLLILNIMTVSGTFLLFIIIFRIIPLPKR